jgi:hypothetical protein
MCGLKSVHIQIVGMLALFLVASLAAQAPFQFDEDAEMQILSTLNRSRAEAGAPVLKLNDKLRDAARQHSTLLVQRHALSHQFPGEPQLTDRLRSAGLFFSAAAENVGTNSQLDDVNDMFLRSPGHRANMLNPIYDAVGIGVVHRGRDYWVTEDFAQLTPSLSAQQVEDQAAASFELKWKKSHRVLPKRVSIEAQRAFACKTAKSGGKLQQSGVTYEGRMPHSVVGFNTPDPAWLAPQVDSVISNANVSLYAVGACTPQQSGDNGQFWIVMSFF